MYFTTYLSRGALVALILVGTTGQAPPSTDLSSSGFAANPYTFAARCDLAQSLFSIHVVVRNRGNSVSFPTPIEAIDSGHAFHGLAVVAPVQPGAEIAITLPILHNASSAGVIGGTHAITVTIGGNPIKPALSIELPVAFVADCAANAPPPVTGPAGPGRRGSGLARGVVTEVAAATPRPGVSQSIRQQGTLPTLALAPGMSKTVIRDRSEALLSAAKLAVPNNVKSVASRPDCDAHVGPLGALFCNALISSGDLLLVWDWQAGAGPDDIDGYRVYRVDAGQKQLVFTQTNKQQTLVDVPKSAGGYTGKCYAVSAYSAPSRESTLSAAFCAAGGSVATTTRLPAAHTSSSQQWSFNNGGPLSTTSHSEGQTGNQMIVGFSYRAKHVTIGADTFSSTYYRSAFQFDISPYVNHRLVVAKLHVQIAASDGEGNNHSCATEIGTGTEFWWRNTSWIEATFDGANHFSDTGPGITIDVTNQVAQWLIGNPNYGLVLRNGDENITAFTNKSCETTYSNPVLELTYY